MRLLAGGYSEAGSPDLLLLDLSDDGHMRKIEGFRLGESPSCFVRHEQWLYIGCETPDYARIWRCLLHEDHLVFINEITLPTESGLCHLLDTPAGVLGSCYGSGTFFMTSHDLKCVRWRWSPGGHAHSAALHSSRLVLADLGRDVAAVSSLSGTVLSETRLPPKTGPRQWLPWRGNWGALICETADCVYAARLVDDHLECSPNPIAMPVAGFPSGACLAEAGRLVVPVRQSGALVFLTENGQYYRTLEDASPRSCHWIGSFLVVCCQQSGYVATYRLSPGDIAFVDHQKLAGAAWAMSLA